jgi:hypothetical protein
MNSHEIEMVEICLELATMATPERRILLDLADKWLAKAPPDWKRARLAAEIEAFKRQH